MRKTQAFTLAEVLITLVIIGVIAAMTIPTLMGNTNQQEFRSKLKKQYSAINQAVAMDYALYGNMPDLNDPSKLEQALKNHLSVIEEGNYNGDNYLLTADGTQFFVAQSNNEHLSYEGMGQMVTFYMRKNRSDNQCTFRFEKWDGWWNGEAQRTATLDWCWVDGENHGIWDVGQYLE